MSVPVVVFFLCALMAVAGAVMVILAREPIHSALALILVMVALAVLYLLLGAPFIAAIQIIVYAGAIMVLFVFVIMLLNAGAEERTNYSKIARIAGVPLALLVLLPGIAYWLVHSGPGATIPHSAGAPVQAGSTRALCEQLFRDYLFPFEATSILILIAILGAFVLAWRDE
jgi:NADH-quinone oxidoreductase subunit J